MCLEFSEVAIIREVKYDGSWAWRSIEAGLFPVGAKTGPANFTRSDAVVNSLWKTSLL